MGGRSVSGWKDVPCDSTTFQYFHDVSDRLVGSRMDSVIMTIREAAEYLKHTEKTACRHAANGKIPGLKVGGAWRYRRMKIDRWIERQSAGQQKRGGTQCRG